ncbi:hypothetical protein HZS_6860 [Henneguya salminicola]|nr:hypothetical protein HZS_6860 [Henneguya salminicola]
MPKIITVDFEYSLIWPVKHEFTASKILGCYFYYKQALLRKLTKFKICMENTKAILSNSILIQNEIVEAFWNYFPKMWIKRFPPSLWNINDFGVYHLARKTNNCLERYNKGLAFFSLMRIQIWLHLFLL